MKTLASHRYNFDASSHANAIEKAEEIGGARKRLQKCIVTLWTIDGNLWRNELANAQSNNERSNSNKRSQTFISGLTQVLPKINSRQNNKARVGKMVILSILLTAAH